MVTEREKFPSLNGVLIRRGRRGGGGSGSGSGRGTGRGGGDDSVSPGGRLESPRSGGKGKMLTLCAGLLFFLVLLMPAVAINPLSTLECHRRQYTYKVHKTDDNGRICWDYINVMSCWGRCDSNEIADWKFPYKRSHHPVCMHESTQLTEVTLRNCDDDVSPGTEIYAFHEATRCACLVCKSSEASCEGIRYRGARRAPRAKMPRG
ncbi:thyrostimulin beta-5 subunit [Macrobrachium rosenbergii]|uniref:thyrostimulin beta-5 subunit n=1 Tax=Macrobrachium rosenbergii TaxID=79674 RepID=UPI0034D57097